MLIYGLGQAVLYVPGQRLNNTLKPCENLPSTFIYYLDNTILYFCERGQRETLSCFSIDMINCQLKEGFSLVDFLQL